MSADGWLGRATRALRSASAILDLGDADRACSSAYYAMFYATRAALFAVGQGERAVGKTHSGMIASFNLHLVRAGSVDVQMGRLLQHEFNRRLIADYEMDGIDAAEAAQAIDNARVFVAAVTEFVEHGIGHSST